MFVSSDAVNTTFYNGCSARILCFNAWTITDTLYMLFYRHTRSQAQGRYIGLAREVGRGGRGSAMMYVGGKEGREVVARLGG